MVDCSFVVDQDYAKPGRLVASSQVSDLRRRSLHNAPGVHPQSGPSAIGSDRLPVVDQVARARETAANRGPTAVGQIHISTQYGNKVI
jgi:hypothetical protein